MPSPGTSQVHLRAGVYERNSMRRSHRVWAGAVTSLALLLTVWAGPNGAQTPRGPNFLAEHYDLTAYLETTGQAINALVKVEFKAQEVSSTVRVELHENLDVKEVKTADGKALSFERDSE